MLVRKGWSTAHLKSAVTASYWLFLGYRAGKIRCASFKRTSTPANFQDKVGLFRTADTDDGFPAQGDAPSNACLVLGCSRSSISTWSHPGHLHRLHTHAAARIFRATCTRYTHVTPYAPDPERTARAPHISLVTAPSVMAREFFTVEHKALQKPIWTKQKSL